METCQQVISGTLAKKSRETCTLADILRQHGQMFRDSHSLSTPQFRAMRAIEVCRTATLGGHRYSCDHCGEVIQQYNSCRNRHCPQCQSIAKAKWLSDRQKDCLPVEYFHVVFTLPHEINLIAQCNHQLIYNLLFQSAWHSISTLGADPKRLDGEMGMISILHTWGQNLSQHIDLHCVIPGGALKADQSWNCANSGFLFPVKAMSRLFRGHYISNLRKAFDNGNLKVPIGDLTGCTDSISFQKLTDQLMQKEWVVYSKPPFDGSKSVLSYLSRYTHKIAISNHRIISCIDGKVKFRWRDYADRNKNKIMELDAGEFIRRFMLHVLPERFVRIRHFGFLSNACRNKRLTIIRNNLSLDNKSQSITKHENLDSVSDWMLHLTGIDITQCPICKKGKLTSVGVIKPLIYWDTS